MSYEKERVLPSNYWIKKKQIVQQCSADKSEEDNNEEMVKYYETEPKGDDSTSYAEPTPTKFLGLLILSATNVPTRKNCYSGLKCALQ